MSTQRSVLLVFVAATAAVAVAVAASRWVAAPPPATSPPISREVDLAPEDYRVDPQNPRELVLGLTLGVGDEVLGASAVETATSVTVRVRVRQELRVKAALGIPATATVTLNDPLGTRIVVDASGRRLAERR